MTGTTAPAATPQLDGLLDGGADVSERSGPYGETPLHVATRRRRLEAVVILLDSGADINAVNAHGKTAWSHAARRGARPAWTPERPCTRPQLAPWLGRPRLALPAPW